jgi:hypothetical protein
VILPGGRRSPWRPFRVWAQTGQPLTSPMGYGPRLGEDDRGRDGGGSTGPGGYPCNRPGRSSGGGRVHGGRRGFTRCWDTCRAGQALPLLDTSAPRDPSDGRTAIVSWRSRHRSAQSRCPGLSTPRKDLGADGRGFRAGNQLGPWSRPQVWSCQVPGAGGLGLTPSQSLDWGPPAETTLPTPRWGVNSRVAWTYSCMSRSRNSRW